MKICYVPSDMDAPGCYRCLFPARQLREKGHEVFMPRYIERDMNDEKGRKRIEFQLDLSPPKPWADIWVLQQRRERMWSEGGVGALRRWGCASIADVDDNYLELPLYNPAWLGTHPYRRDDGVILNRHARRKLKSSMGHKIEPNMANRDHMHEAFRQVDAMTVSTPYLAQLYSEYNKRIYVVRNLLDWDIWEDVQPQYEVERERLRIGYLGVFTYRQGDLQIIRNVIGKFMRKHPEIDFVANSEATHDYLGVPEGQRVIVPEYSFRPGEGEDYPVGAKTAVLDIGLVPLAMNGLNEAKSHLKGMEYNAAGIPFIASPTESYKDYWCEEGVNGFLAFGEKDWERHLEFLVQNETIRREMGEDGRRKAEEHTFQKRIGEWEAVYKDVVGDRYTRVARQSITVGAVQKVTELEHMLRKSEGAKVIVEIGSARGGTFWAFSQVAHEKATLVSIDIPSGSPLDVRNGKDVYAGRPERQRIAAFASDNQEAVMIDANSQQEETVELLKMHLRGKKIDVLFIDGDHRYEGVKRDWELYMPLVKKGGLIFFHDVTEQNDERSGVHLLWDELKLDWKYEEFIGADNWGVGRWGGIGVIYKP